MKVIYHWIILAILCGRGPRWFDRSMQRSSQQDVCRLYQDYERTSALYIDASAVSNRLTSSLWKATGKPCIIICEGVWEVLPKNILAMQRYHGGKGQGANGTTQQRQISKTASTPIKIKLITTTTTTTATTTTEIKAQQMSVQHLLGCI